MRKLLFVLGIGGIGYAVYNYFNKQLQLALDWEFKVKGFNILNISKDNAKLKLNLEILNKSNFNLLVKDYDLKIFYEGVEVGTCFQPLEQYRLLTVKISFPLDKYTLATRIS